MLKKKKRERERETPRVLPPPRILLSGTHLGWSRRAPPGRTLSQNDWPGKNPETNPITIKPKTASHVTEQSSWVPLPSCSSPGRPFPIKSLALSAYVSPWTIHFRVKDKSALSGLGRGPPSYNQTLGLCPRGKRTSQFTSYHSKAHNHRKGPLQWLSLPTIKKAKLKTASLTQIECLWNLPVGIRYSRRFHVRDYRVVEIFFPLTQPFSGWTFFYGRNLRESLRV